MEIVNWYSYILISKIRRKNLTFFILFVKRYVYIFKIIVFKIKIKPALKCSHTYKERLKHILGLCHTSISSYEGSWREKSLTKTRNWENEKRNIESLVIMFHLRVPPTWLIILFSLVNFWKSKPGCCCVSKCWRGYNEIQSLKCKRFSYLFILFPA